MNPTVVGRVVVLTTTPPPPNLLVGMLGGSRIRVLPELGTVEIGLVPPKGEYDMMGINDITQRHNLEEVGHEDGIFTLEKLLGKIPVEG